MYFDCLEPEWEFLEYQNINSFISQPYGPQSYVSQSYPESYATQVDFFTLKYIAKQSK